MRIAVLSDVHGNLPALEAVMSHLKTQGGYDEIWVLGDLAVFCPYPAQVLERLAPLPKARFVQGNTDGYLVTGRRPPQMAVQDESQWKSMPGFLKERDASFRWTVSQVSYEGYLLLRELPFQHRAEIPSYGAVLAVHGSPLGDEVGVWEHTTDADLRDMLSSTDFRLLLCGHTHCPLDRSLDSKRVINVGSVGLPLDGDRRAAYAMLDIEGDQCQSALHRVEYDIDSAQKKILLAGLPEILSMRLAYGQ